MKSRISISIAARALALCLLAALLLAGTALGEVSREGLVGEWLFEKFLHFTVSPHILNLAPEKYP